MTGTRLAPVTAEPEKKPKGRQRLTKFEYAVIFLEQGGKCACGCGQKLEEGKVDEEHTLPNYFKPGKPDALWLRKCHKKKTRKDNDDIDKCRRRRLEEGQQARRKRSGSKFPKLTKEQRKARYQARKAWAEKERKE